VGLSHHFFLFLILDWRDNYLLVASLVRSLNTSEVNMKSIGLGTAGLVLALSASALASTPAPTNAAPAVPVVTLSPTKPLIDNSFGSQDSFLVVDKSDQDFVDSATSDRGVTQTGGKKSVESSGNPVDTSGVPMPRAGWISFFGLLAVIAARQFGLLRRRFARTA
jgi:hypothetical protein